MVKASLFFWAAVLATLPTVAIADPLLPCVAGTVATVLAQGTCTIADTIFDFTSYRFINFGNVSSPNSTADVTFMPLAGDPLNPGFRLAGPFDSSAGDFTMGQGYLDYQASVTDASTVISGVKVKEKVNDRTIPA
jgi:hypothetical protein